VDIAITIVIVVALVIVALSAIKDYRAEASKSSASPLPDGSIDPMSFLDVGCSSADSPHSHSGHHFDPGCIDSHHSGCDVGGHDSFDAGHGDFGGHH